ncbi:dephospho-CoA kinase [Psychromonas ingrahamii 37]|uniref:Dephospho-CoA kinase n=1 Tax=Psychromonas ingrahamii (strain DSM 17664 / CCUG 51855 / 37) TaxID=357804 RepID=A1SU31_PSYIN|nr:dephospho-CoA kinase [Psychromonas ingrahamii]ABM02996.1 dephospho-CoA kinase [Psychromonas ingrahamii 37]
MTLIIGLTGGIGSGKSTVSRFFSELGIQIIDADFLARQVVEKGQPALREIEQHFGHEVLMSGELNRPFLRELIFKNEQEKLWINNLLHPLIRAQIVDQLAKAKGDYVLLEAPLLFENNLDKLTDYDLVVDASPALQVKRACARDGAGEEVIYAIIASQIDRKTRLQKADFIIDNNHLARSALEKIVQQLDTQFRKLKN